MNYIKSLFAFYFLSLALLLPTQANAVIPPESDWIFNSQSHQLYSSKESACNDGAAANDTEGHIYKGVITNQAATGDWYCSVLSKNLLLPNTEFQWAYSTIVSLHYYCPVGYRATGGTQGGPPDCTEVYFSAWSGIVPEQCNSIGHPINFDTGNKYLTEVVGISEGVAGFDFKLHYNSKSSEKWTYNFARSIEYSDGIVESKIVKLGTVFDGYSTPGDACLAGLNHFKAQVSDPELQLTTASYENSQCVIRKQNNTVWDVMQIYQGDPDATYVKHVIVHAPTTKIIRGNGKRYTYMKQGGSWVSNGTYPDTLEELVDESNNRTGWKITNSRNETETYDVNGKLLSIQGLTGNTKTFSYTTTGQLEKVETNLGHSISFAYSSESEHKILGITDNANRGWSYRYTLQGYLEYIDYPDGTTKQFHYENQAHPHAVTGVTDQRGVRYANYNYDALGNAILTTLADNVDRVDIAYNSDNTRTITNSRNKVSTYHLTTQNGAQLVTSIEGPGCSSCQSGDSTTEYDGLNRIISKTKKGVTTQYGDYDVNGNYGYKINAVGTPEERRTDYTYHPDFHNKVATISGPSVHASDANARKVTTYSYDTFGNTSAVTLNGFKPDGTAISRSTQLTYSGPLNQLSQIDGPRTDVADLSTFEYYLNEA
ncbi:hypothetical protein ACFL2V_22040, partial [Pseudomonadota bacterium]